MLSLVVFLTASALIASEVVEPPIERTIGDGENNWDLGRRIVYGDEDITVINEVITDMEKNSGLKSKVRLNEQLKPLDPQDVKCLMSVDKYCSKEMGQMKSLLIDALKNDCKSCSQEQKEKAGKVVASMMAHDPAAWKLFLTRSALQTKKTKREVKTVEELRFKVVGEPEEITNSKYRYTAPGFKVRVKRFDAERIL